MPRKWRETFSSNQDFLWNLVNSKNIFQVIVTGGKYLIKIIFDIGIETCIFEISSVPKFNKFWAFSILGLICA